MNEATLNSLQDLGSIAKEAKLPASILKLVVGSKEKKDAKIVTKARGEIAMSKKLLTQAKEANSEAVQHDKYAAALKTNILQLEEELRTKRTNAVDLIKADESVSALLTTYKGEKLSQLQTKIQEAANQMVRDEFPHLYEKKDSLNFEYGEAISYAATKRQIANENGEEGRALFKKAQEALQAAGLWNDKE